MRFRLLSCCFMAYSRACCSVSKLISYLYISVRPASLAAVKRVYPSMGTSSSLQTHTGLDLSKPFSSMSETMFASSFSLMGSRDWKVGWTIILSRLILCAMTSAPEFSPDVFLVNAVSFAIRMPPK